MTDSGIRCPRCNCGHHFVRKTFPAAVVESKGKRITVIRRERVCRHCGKNFYTRERTEDELFTEEGKSKKAENINPYLGDEP